MDAHGAHKSCQEPPGTPRISNQQPGAASWQPPGAARSRQEHTGAARCVDGRMGVRKGWQQGVKDDVENT